MGLEDAKRQKSEQLELPLVYKGETPNDQRSAEALTAAYDEKRSSNEHLMELVVAESNMFAAMKRVRRNKGSPGIDGMSVEELPEYMACNWWRIREELLAGSYRPQPVKRVEIPKSSGGVRQLGIPTVVAAIPQTAAELLKFFWRPGRQRWGG